MKNISNFVDIRNSVLNSLLGAFSNMRLIVTQSDKIQASKTCFYIIFAVTQLMGVACVVIAVVYGFYLGGFEWGSNEESQFHFHPVFMVCGMVFFYGNAVMVFRAADTHKVRITIAKCINKIKIDNIKLSRAPEEDKS